MRETRKVSHLITSPLLNDFLCAYLTQQIFLFTEFLFAERSGRFTKYI